MGGKTYGRISGIAAGSVAANRSAALDRRLLPLAVARHLPLCIYVVHGMLPLGEDPHTRTT